MNRTLVNRVANAVLYEGYILYPYRPSVKNRHRWTFGGLYPQAYCRHQNGSDASRNQTECLVQGNAETTLNITIRFLHLLERSVGKLDQPLTDWQDGRELPFQPVESLRIGDEIFHTWQEAEERQIELASVALKDIESRPALKKFAFPGRRWVEPLCEPGGQIAGMLVRRQQAIEGAIEIKGAKAGDGWKITLGVMNQTSLDESLRTNRDEALLHSLVSPHAILGVSHGDFVSLLDPPEPFSAAAADCRNIGTWPVLVGEAGASDTMLSSPIILYDYPQIAPESPGDLFDGTEIDEILTLRILTLTEEEKRAAAGVDIRARDLLARTNALAQEQLLSLHGTLRSVQPSSVEDA